MTFMDNTYGFYFGRPVWLAALILLIPVIWLGLRNLNTLGSVRRILAIVLRSLVILILIALLARPMLTRINRRMTLITVIDRSQSIPADLQQASLDYLSKALEKKVPGDKLAVVDVAEAASITKLPGGDVSIRQRNASLDGQQSKLADGIQMALAISPPDAASRILLVSEGNQTEGDLEEAARIAAVNGIPIDVLPLHYQYENEVIFRRLAVPARARSGQTISLRFILNSTAKINGKLLLSLNGEPVDIAPDSAEVAVPVQLEPGTNVKTVSIPLGSRGIHKFEAVFMPDVPAHDVIVQNNKASAITYVAGPGHVLIVDMDGTSGQVLEAALRNSDIDVERGIAADFPHNLVELMDTDAVILVNTDCSKFTFQQQELLCRYVNDLGGGLIMTGGPQAFGAGGWIGSPVADILPVELDPPQKQKMPKGALALVIDRSGSMKGQKVELCKLAAVAAVRLLSRRDLVGLIIFDATSVWLIELQPAQDKDAICQKIRTIGAGGGTTMGPALEMAYDALTDADVAVKHMIVLTDGQTSDKDVCARLGASMAGGEVTVTTVAVGPQADSKLLYDIAQGTQGRFYQVTDPMNIPEIFIKEAQVVRRSMIIEETFTPQIVSAFSEIVRNTTMQLPVLDGYVLTGPKSGLNQTVLTSNQADPILATCQSGMGRCVAFTSSVDSRWASSWLQWGGFDSFWEQTVRWAGKPAQSADCEVTTEILGRGVNVYVEAIDSGGKFVQFADIVGQVIAPDVTTETLDLSQTGPGQYQGRFQAASSGSYIINLKYRKLTQDETYHFTTSAVTIPFAPEFRDLSDNVPLLTKVSEISGGKVLSSDPNQANLFDYSGLTFPETQLPLLLPLMLIWLGLFLLDVAVRRVVLDFRAMARKAVSFVRLRKRKEKTDATVERLRLKRMELHEKLFSRKSAAASKRYEAAQDYKGDLPVTDSEKKPEPKTKPEKPQRQTADQQEEDSHIQRLLRAKRKAVDKDKKDMT